MGPFETLKEIRELPIQDTLFEKYHGIVQGLKLTWKIFT